MGRMGQQLIRSSKNNKNFKLVSLTENKIINKKISGIKPGLNNIESFKNTNVIIDFTIPNEIKSKSDSFTYKHNWKKNEPVILPVNAVSKKAAQELSQISVKRVNSRTVFSNEALLLF